MVKDYTKNIEKEFQAKLEIPIKHISTIDLKKNAIVKSKIIELLNFEIGDI